MTIKEAYDKGFKDRARANYGSMWDDGITPGMEKYLNEKYHELTGYDPPKEEKGDEPKEK